MHIYIYICTYIYICIYINYTNITVLVLAEKESCFLKLVFNLEIYSGRFVIRLIFGGS